MEQNIMIEYQGAPNLNQDRFLEELDFITEKCAGMGQEYALLRGALQSLDGLEGKFPQSVTLNQPAIRFFNETKNLRINRFVGVVWALSERMAEPTKKKSSLSSALINKLPATYDMHKFGGDMTLMRMRDMYKRATELHPDILKKKAISLLPYMEEREWSKIVEGAADELSNLCGMIDAHLSDDAAWEKIEYFRGTFAHSLKYPKIALNKGWTEESPEYRYNELYEFGDRAATIAIDFKRAWSFSRTCSGVEEVAEMIEEEYEEFWTGFFGNPLFYDDER